MAYVTWEYYNSLFANMDEETFMRLSGKAEIKVDAITHMRAKRFIAQYDEENATDFQKQVLEQIKVTVCEAIQAMEQHENSGMGSGITSISNDGYSETYRIVTASEKEAQLTSIIRAGLSGTGLAGAL